MAIVFFAVLGIALVAMFVILKSAGSTRARDPARDSSVMPVDGGSDGGHGHHAGDSGDAGGGDCGSDGGGDGGGGGD